jgi:S-adenosylmethionine:tRNA ribosyltransferase-isomerase
MIAASLPLQRSADARLLVVDDQGEVSHHARVNFLNFVRAGDVVIANDAATLPASLTGVHARTGSVIEVRLAGRPSLAAEEVTQLTAVVFGAGDFRTPTEFRPLPPQTRVGDTLRLGPLTAVVTAVLGHPRLVAIRFSHSAVEVWEGLARHGRPIQYAHVAEPLPIWDTWTRIASRPVAFEPPSASFMLDWATIRSIRSRGAGFATVTHAAGISSTGDEALDALLPLDEPYEIPAATAALIELAPGRRGRVIAIGTTVVRALEDAANGDGTVRTGCGVATQRIGSHSSLTVVDAIVSGMHERGTSHYELLRAFQDDATLERMAYEADARDYRTHEFGDSVLMLRRAGKAGKAGGAVWVEWAGRAGKAGKGGRG